MKLLMKQIVPIFLAGALLLAGCGRQADREDSPDNADNLVALGRYLEEQLALPDGIGYVALLEMDSDGSLTAVGNKTRDYALGPWLMWRSEDFGESWKTEAAPWLEEIGEGAISSIASAPDGGRYVLYTPITVAQMREAMAAEDLEDYTYPEEVFAHTDGTTLTPMPYDLGAGEYGGAANIIRVAANGDLIAAYYTELKQLDPVTGEVKASFQAQGEMFGEGNYQVVGNTLAFSENGQVTLYDLETGGFIEALTPPGGSISPGRIGIMDGSSEKVFHIDPDARELYTCDSTGIYRSAFGGATSERMVDGELTSLGMPSVSLVRMFLGADNSFLVQAYTEKGEEQFLLRYRYDPDAPTVPGTELRVYSLEDNKTVRQAIGMFQRQNPQVKVTYETGMSGEDGVTASDALRTLSNELLAGQGPDVLLLDGIPVESYISQGALMDMSEALESRIASGELLANVAGVYRRTDGLYGVPARFSVPMVQGADAVSSFRNMADLVDWLEAQKDPRLEYTDAANLVRIFYPVYAPTWFGPDGSLDTESFAKSLEELKRLMQVTGALDEETAQVASSFGLSFGAVAWLGNMVTLNIGHMTSLEDLAAPDAAIKSKGGGAISILQGEAGGVFIPGCILGVNNAGNQKDLAMEFVEFTLSTEVLVHSFSDGLPVNAAALEQNAQNPYTGEDRGIYYSVSLAMSEDEDGEEEYASASLQVEWPEAAYMRSVIEELRGLQVASPVNLTVRELLLQETEGYFAGSRTLEETVDAFQQKIDLYLSE